LLFSQKERPIAFLLAEDNPVNQAIMKRMLQHPKWTVDFAENGEQV
jgi:CheY-like chemotaxis protein